MLRIDSLLRSETIIVRDRINDVEQTIFHAQQDPDMPATMTYGQLLTLLHAMQALCMTIVRCEDIRLDRLRKECERLVTFCSYDSIH